MKSPVQMRRKLLGRFFVGMLIIGCAQFSFAEPEVETGKKAASDYFKARKPIESKSRRSSNTRSPSAEDASRYLGLHIGGYLNDTAYRWTDEKKVEDPGELQVGITYRVGEWRSSMDLLFRVDFISYEFDDKEATKMSVLPIVTFPDARSKFPLYFGAGLGMGIFFKQVSDESDLSLDYQLLAGARFFNLVDTLGFFVETGMKNHVHLLSDGQHNGVFFAGGALFTF